ncbi:Phosphatase dcr2 [Neofusicoccum ribis]|uniref:Phosphatase dcr2 n=1 Tax=Neofusicoccum ribis TaxID=45134 RepID=A0ABR3SZG8_9PEZI
MSHCADRGEGRHKSSPHREHLHFSNSRRGVPETWHHSLTMALNLVEASISDLRNALDSGAITSVELTTRYLLRISTYDCRGPRLNSIPILNPAVLRDAAASDARRAADRAAGRPSRPLEGIPYTVKDSYKVKGLTVASGSPAFSKLIANEDAFTVQKLREAGAVLIGKTNMPPMAAGGMQRGVYGRAESPYNAAYLTAAFASGSSNGSATSTAASFAAFGMAEETVSSGRSPASNNGLVAYTPSRGVLSIRGNWPLYPTCDVVVPHTRTVSDLLTLLDVLAARDPITTGDFWRAQPFIPLPSLQPPPTHHALASPTALAGKRIALPRMYIGGADSAPTARPVALRPSIAALLARARAALEAAGATVVETDFPLVANYEARSAAGQLVTVPGLPDDWLAAERGPLLALAWDAFLRDNASNDGPSSSSQTDFAAHVDAAKVFPVEAGGVQTRYAEPANRIDWCALPAVLRAWRGERGAAGLLEYPGLGDALRALEAARERDLEGWMRRVGVDLVAFPANGDVGRAEADVDDDAAREAWRNGVLYSNGNRVLRHLGVPTVSVCMGVMEDTAMPVNLTFAGRAYADQELLAVAWAFEKVGGGRVSPGRIKPLESDVVDLGKTMKAAVGKVELNGLKAEKSEQGRDGAFVLNISGRVEGAGQDFPPLRLYVDGEDISDKVKLVENGFWQCSVERPATPKLWHPEYLKEAGVEEVLLEKTMVIAVAGEWGQEIGDVVVV